MQMNEYEAFYDGHDDEDEAPVCVCPEYFGTTKVTFCRVCGDFTDNLEIALNEEEPEPVKMAVVMEQMLTNTNRVMAALYRAMDKKEVA